MLTAVGCYWGRGLGVIRASVYHVNLVVNDSGGGDLVK